MSVLLTKLFVADALERAVKTVAQTIVALLTADSVLNLFSINWGEIWPVAGLAGL